MYLDIDQIHRPAVPPDVSPVKGILSLYSFFMLSPGVFAARPYSCWCPACSHARGRGQGMVSAGNKLNVPGCMRSKLTVWEEFKVTSTEAAGIANREKRLEERCTKLRPHLKPGNYAAVQARERWSTAEEVHLRPGHHWVFELGDAGGGKGCFEKTFKLARRTWEMYKVRNRAVVQTLALALES